jgi:methionyl-tRNA formyltransferase
MAILLIGKQGDAYCDKAQAYLRSSAGSSHSGPSGFGEVTVVTGKRGDALPAEALAWTGDWLISYLSPWIIPESLYARASQGALNFHPGSPDYPGIGCTNFAIYNGEKEFGITCHHLAAKVDTGPVVAVRRFPLLESDSVWTLTQRCYEEIFALFTQVMDGIRAGQPLPRSPEHWTRKPYTRKELNDLCALKLEMGEAEILRRVRALTFPGMPGAYLLVDGKKIELRL